MESTVDRILATLQRRGEYPTASEIAQETGEKLTKVTYALRKLESAGQVRKVGTAFSGARTWALSD